MSRKILLPLSIFSLIVVLVGGLWALTSYYLNLPNRLSQHETIVLGPNRFVPDSQAAMRVVVRDSKDASPLPGAAIKVSLQPAEGGRAVPLFEGVTDARGTTNVTFRVPADADPDQILLIETKSKLGADSLERTVMLQRDYRVLLTTDKPIYQPGQVIHVRALALSAFDLTPAAAQNLEVTIADGKGNKVFRKTLQTSEYGVASTDFQLADQVNSGAYKITATLDSPKVGEKPSGVEAEKTVTVQYYVLPKFKVEMTTDRSFYLPGQHVSGSLSANYFFGKPVAGGEVTLEGYTFDVARSTTFSLQGTTDESGNFSFEFDLPAYIAGTDLEGGLGRFYLQASLTDLAKHTEISNLSLPIAGSTLLIEAVPEGGQFRPDVENILYLLVSYPDGQPAEANLRVTFQNTSHTVVANSGSYGLAEVRLIPDSPYQSVQVEARDLQGNAVSRNFFFEGSAAEETVLLRPDRPVYRVGETMNLTILTSQSRGTVYLDMVREGQTISTRSVDVSSGRAEVAVDLTPDMYGTLELHAYKILSWGGITRDTRLVVVDQVNDLVLSLTPEKGTGGEGGGYYRPGDAASLDIRVNGRSGEGVQAAIGLAIVDESVFALAEQDPGFAKLYFLLESQLLQPRYDLHGFSIPDLMSGIPSNDPQLKRAVADTAQASLAVAVRSSGRQFALQANSHEDAIQRAADRQEKYFLNLSKGLYGLIILLPLTVLGLSGFAAWREKRLGKSLALVFGLLLLLALLFFLWPIDKRWGQIDTPSYRFSLLLNWLSGYGWMFMLAVILVGLGGLLALIVIAWRKKDRSLGWMLGLIPLFIAIFVFLVFAASRSNPDIDEKVVLWSLIVISLIPFAFLLRAAAFTWGRQPLPAFASLTFALFLPVVFVLMMMGGGAMSPRMEGQVLAGGIRELVVEEMKVFALSAPPAAGVETAEADVAHSGAIAEPPRLRQYFPETMLWLPDAVTDADGYLHLDFPVADSITTWRMTALASSQDGRLGSTIAGLRVFQDFFIDLDLPLALTVGDEVSIPVGVFNYLPESQIVRLEVEKADWFELLDEPTKELTIGANDISVVYFRVKATQFGRQPFKVTAWGSQMSDAIQKEVRIFPDGKQITFTQSDRLTPTTPIRQNVFIPPEAIPGTQSLLIKIYPGVVSQVVEGLDSILRMPFGCFEQTSSTTYPNVLVLDYLKTTTQASPEVQMKAEEYINLGYQRLTTFEVSSGGFSLFGEEPADRMLTAYGLQEFADMSRVHEVDPAIIQRAAEWLLSQQSGDGSWENDRGLVHEDTWSSLGNDRLPVTAYIVWSLIDADFGGDSRTQKGLQYIHEFQSQAEDPYVLALVANALVAGEASSSLTSNVLDRLAGMAIREGNSAYWKSGVATFMGSEGQTGSIETTALAAYAFLRSGTHPDLANAALTYLVRQKDNFGTWHSTQATVLSLKALIESVRAGAEKVNAAVTITLNGSQTRNVQVTPENFDVVQLVAFDDVNPGRENIVEINVQGEGNLMYQISGGYYLPWDKLALYPELSRGEQLVKIDVQYDRAELAVNDTVNVNVTLSLNEGKAESAMIDLGLPPGFSVESQDLAALVARYNDTPQDYPYPKIERFELTGRQILIYLSNLSAGNPLTFSYRLRAKFPLEVQTPASNAYDYYNPEVSGEVEPQILVVRP